MSGMARSMVLAAISFYQRYVSPYKGFCCAYRHHTGRQSCSMLGIRVVRRYGAFKGLAVLRRRLYLCGVAHRRYTPVGRVRAMGHQQGFCDVGCDIPCDFSFDLPDIDLCSSIGDCGSCDWPSRDKKQNNDEQYVHIPPNVGNEGKRRG